MKKIYLLFAVLFLAASAFAQAPELTIKKLNTTPDITDGVFDAIWDEVDEVDVLHNDEGSYADATVDVYFKMAYNDTALFVCVNRVDDEALADEWITTLGDWKSDRDELFFDTFVDTLDDGIGADNSNRAGEGADYGHYQMLSIWVENTTTNPQYFRNAGASCWYHYATYWLGYNFVSPLEYDAEWCIPFNSFNNNPAFRAPADLADTVLRPIAGNVFGFNAQIIDVDMYDNPTDETFRKIRQWVGIDAWGSMDGAGLITFSADYIIGVDDQEAAFSVSAYPSPASDFIMLQNLKNPVDVEIYNIIGRVVQTQENVGSGTRMDVSSLSEGVYFINVGNEGTVKFIKE